MENMILATPSLSDAATLKSSTSPSTLPPENLQLSAIGKVWRALDPLNAYLVIDLQSAMSINLFALLGHSGSSRSYGRVRAATSEANLTAAPGYDSGLLPMRSHQSGYDATWAAGVSDEQYGALDKNHFILWLGANPRTYRYWRIDIVDPNADYFDAGRLYISNAWQPETNMVYGFAHGMIDPSQTPRTVGGRQSPKERPKYRWAEFQLSFSSQDEMYDNAFEIERLFGSTRDLLFVPDPTEKAHLQRRTVYGTLKSLQPIINTSYSIYEKSFRIEEITA